MQSKYENTDVFRKEIDTLMRRYVACRADCLSQILLELLEKKMKRMDASCKRRITNQVKNIIQRCNWDRTTTRMIIEQLVESGIPNVSETRKYIRSAVQKQLGIL